MEDVKNTMADTDENDNVAHDFDADTYFKSEGMTFVKKNDDGTAHVAYEDGSEGVFDPKEFARTHGMEPSKDFDVTYNSPEAPVNESPVGFVDRFKMSLGNTKGSVGYLKTKFPDATVDSSGDLVVKDSGVWKRVDLAGISGDDGWKVSEILGDVADVGGDLLVGAGSLASIGATGGASAVGLAAAGSGAAGAVKGVLGRIAGTYDASPEEFMKDVMLDTALGLGGEAVMLGGKAVLAPTLAKGLSKLSTVGEATQDLLAKGFAAVDPENGYGTFRSLLARGDEVVPNLAKKVDRAADMANSTGADAAVGAASETQQVALSKILYQDTVAAAEPLVKDIQGTQTRYYEREAQDIIAKNMSGSAFQEAQISAKQYGGEAANQLDQLLHSQGLMETVAERTSAVTRTTESAASREATSSGKMASKTKGYSVSTDAEGMSVKRPFDTARAASTESSTTANTSAKATSAQRSTSRTVVEQKTVTAKALATWASEKGGNKFATEEGMKPLADALNAVRKHVGELSTKGFKDPKDVFELMKSGRELHKILDTLPADAAEVFEKGDFGKFMANYDKAVKNMLPKGMQEGFNTLSANYRVIAADMRKLAGGIDVARSSVNFRDVAGSLVEKFRAAQHLTPNGAKDTAHNILQSLKTVNPEAGKHLAKVELENATMAFGGSGVASSLSSSGAIARGATALGKKLAFPAAMGVSKMQRRASLKAFLGSPAGQQFMSATRVLKAGGRTIAQKPELVAAGLTTALSALQQRR